jgi:hypothetical protein
MTPPFPIREHRHAWELVERCIHCGEIHLAENEITGTPRKDLRAIDSLLNEPSREAKRRGEPMSQVVERALAQFCITT